LSSGASSSLANLGAAYGTGTGAINQGYTDASGALAGGYNAANGYYDQAAGAYPWWPLPACHLKHSSAHSYATACDIHNARPSAPQQ